MIDEMRTEHAEDINDPQLPPIDETQIYKTALRTRQKQIETLPERLSRAKRSMILVFEGWDASGKGGTIRRITDALREDRVQVFATGAPSAEEASRHYLWRFWRTVPPVGHIAIYDRSWYGRVLVERVEGLTPEPDWRRAYGEIRDFERTLIDGGTLLHKFWLEISPEEQLARFEARLRTPEKRHKLTDEDWRNRSHRAAYLPALREMLHETDTPFAPWEIIDAEDKRSARIAVLDSIAHSAAALPL